MSAVKASALAFERGDRVYLGGSHGEEPKGRVVDFIVSGVIVRFDDGVEIEVGADDPDLVPEAEAPKIDGRVR